MFVQATDTTGLIIEEFGAELVVYDHVSNTAHLLDARAAAIWRACAKGAHVGELMTLVDPGSDEERGALVRLAVSDLQRAGLVVTAGGATPVSRRGVLGSLGRAASVPFVISILAPTPAAAVTCGPMPTKVCNIANGDLDCSGSEKCSQFATCPTCGSLDSLGTFCCLGPNQNGCPCTDPGGGDCCSGNCVANVCA